MVLPEPSEPVIIFCSLTPPSTDSMMTIMFFIAAPLEASTTLTVKGSSSSCAWTDAVIETKTVSKAKMKISE